MYVVYIYLPYMKTFMKPENSHIFFPDFFWILSVLIFSIRLHKENEKNYYKSLLKVYMKNEASNRNGYEL